MFPQMAHYFDLSTRAQGTFSVISACLYSPYWNNSYLELILAFKISLAAKRDEISTAKRRYEVGLEKLAFATESVNAMQVGIYTYTHIHIRM